MRWLMASLVVLAACGGDGPGSDNPDGSSGKCLQGATECRADGVYTCNATGSYDRTEACSECVAEPSPHCVDACDEAGKVSKCVGDSIQSCANSTMQSCAPGSCIDAGRQAVCVTNAVTDQCLFEDAQGSYTILCGDGSSVSTEHVCDQRSGMCVPGTYDCAALTSVPVGQVQCDATSGHLYTSCDGGQPSALACEQGTKCASNGTFNCYTAPTNGVSCGGPAVCYPNMICTQTNATTSSCVTPAGQLACNSTDVLAVCTSQNTGFACVRGAFWRWDNLTTWGGSCTSNHVNVPAGGNCIPGLADCAQGLACNKSPYDIAGVCGTPLPGAPAECVLTGQASLGTSCQYQWNSCANGNRYAISCVRQNIGGNLITLCDCYVNGVNTMDFGGTEVCMASDLAMLDAAAAQKCGWTVETVGVSGQ